LAVARLKAQFAEWSIYGSRVLAPFGIEKMLPR